MPHPACRTDAARKAQELRAQQAALDEEARRRAQVGCGFNTAGFARLCCVGKASLLAPSALEEARRRAQVGWPLLPVLGNASWFQLTMRPDAWGGWLSSLLCMTWHGGTARVWTPRLALRPGGGGVSAQFRLHCSRVPCCPHRGYTTPNHHPVVTQPAMFVT